VSAPADVPVAAPAVAPVTAAPALEEPAAGGATEAMQRRDLNGDGKLNIVELRLWLGPSTELGRWDTDHDGAVDIAELGRLLQEVPVNAPAGVTNSPRR